MKKYSNFDVKLSMVKINDLKSNDNILKDFAYNKFIEKFPRNDSNKINYIYDKYEVIDENYIRIHYQYTSDDINFNNGSFSVFVEDNCTKDEIFKMLGWTVVCESPYEIQHHDGSFASGHAADILEDYLINNWESYV